MPMLYAKRFLSEKANEANLQRIDTDKSHVSDILNSIFEDFKYGY